MSNTFLLRITTISLVLAASSVIFTNAIPLINGPVPDVKRVLLRESRSGMEELKWSVKELPRDFTEAKHDVQYYWRVYSIRLVAESRALADHYFPTEKPAAGPQTAQVVSPGQRR